MAPEEITKIVKSYPNLQDCVDICLHKRRVGFKRMAKQQFPQVPEAVLDEAVQAAKTLSECVEYINAHPTVQALPDALILRESFSWIPTEDLAEIMTKSASDFQIAMQECQRYLPPPSPAVFHPQHDAMLIQMAVDLQHALGTQLTPMIRALEEQLKRMAENPFNVFIMLTETDQTYILHLLPQCGQTFIDFVGLEQRAQGVYCAKSVPGVQNGIQICSKILHLRQNTDDFEIAESGQEAGEMAGAARSSNGATQLALALASKTNHFRQINGKTKLVWHKLTARIAMIHSQQMATGAKEFGHDGQTERWARLPFKQVHGGVEQIGAADGQTVDSLINKVFDGWLASENHRNNLLEDYIYIGVGCGYSQNGYYYFTQILVNAN